MKRSHRKPDFSGVKRAFEKLRSAVPPTPLKPLRMGESTIWCKCESAQPMGAFKLRGAWHRLTDLTEAEKRCGVVAFSSGNHAQGVAWAAQRLGIQACIVMPHDTPTIKLAGTRRLGAEIIFYDRMTESREEIAATLAAHRGAVLVPSFDDPWIVEGQGTAGLEAAAQMREMGQVCFDLVISPCGGGGLAAGLSLALPDARVAIVEPEGWDDMGASLARGEIVPVAPNPPQTSCDALQTLRVAPLTFDILMAHSVSALSVTENEIFTAMRYAFDALGVVVEPGGAVGLAALLAEKIEPGEQTLLLLSGGNVDQSFFEKVVNSPHLVV